jgi:hypothetical protein
MFIKVCARMNTNSAHKVVIGVKNEPKKVMIFSVTCFYNMGFIAEAGLSASSCKEFNRS